MTSQNRYEIHTLWFLSLAYDPTNGHINEQEARRRLILTRQVWSPCQLLYKRLAAAKMAPSPTTQHADLDTRLHHWFGSN